MYVSGNSEVKSIDSCPLKFNMICIKTKERVCSDMWVCVSLPVSCSVVSLHPVSADKSLLLGCSFRTDKKNVSHLK